MSKVSSQHGGRRPGAGRKPSFPHEPIAAALANAVEGKPAFLLIAAMQALDAPLDDLREALGLSRDRFMVGYGEFISASAALHRTQRT